MNVKLKVLQNNLTLVTINPPGIDIWFSYETPVAFWKMGYGMIVSENVWSNTTRKHLNAIDDGDKNHRVANEQFNILLKEALSKR